MRTESHNCGKKKKTVIIGIGNEFRNDDAIGIITARKLKEKELPDVDVIENSGDGATLMDIWESYEKVIIIDAIKNNIEPGSIIRIDANEEKLPNGMASFSSHLFSVTEAIETSRVINKLPQKFAIYGIEGKNFEFGTGISREASNASDKIVKKIMGEIST